jgi:hypothetical protein
MGALHAWFLKLSERWLIKVRNAFLSFISRASVHPDPDRLLEQAEMLITSCRDETDLRRAVSNAYYAVFHYALRGAADLTIGVANRGTPRYELAYCSVEHKRFKELCNQIAGGIPSKSVIPYAPPSPDYFGPVADFARLCPNIQEERHSADYHPTARFDDVRALQAVSHARAAIKFIEAATTEQREAFLTLLLFKPRQP